MTFVSVAPTVGVTIEQAQIEQAQIVAVLASVLVPVVPLDLVVQLARAVPLDLEVQLAPEVRRFRAVPLDPVVQLVRVGRQAQAALLQADQLAQEAHQLVVH